MFSQVISLLILTALSSVQAVTQTVTVGANGARTYEPNNIKAAMGDIVNFVFAGGNHTVTQSTFADPCAPSGFRSGFRPASDAAANTFAIMINSTEPIWVFCAQTGHCQAGMVMAINAPDTGDRTFAAFQAAAQGGGGANGTTPGGAAGGAGGNGTATPGGGAGSNGTAASGGGASGASGTASAGASGASSAASASATGGADPIGISLPLAGLLALFSAVYSVL